MMHNVLQQRLPLLMMTHNKNTPVPVQSCCVQHIYLGSHTYMETNSCPKSTPVWLNSNSKKNLLNGIEQHRHVFSLCFMVNIDLFLTTNWLKIRCSKRRLIKKGCFPFLKEIWFTGIFNKSVILVKTLSPSLLCESHPPHPFCCPQQY